MILAGDIGGTNSRFALFTAEAGQLKSVFEAVYPSREHKTLEELLRAFVATKQAKIEHACFGIAGPIKNGRAQGINLAWVVDSVNVARELGLKQVKLINDLEANAWGIGGLSPDDFVTLNPGAAVAGNCAVIAAGTGLGEAGLFWDGKRHLPFACEGGHADFAPSNELEEDLGRYLRAQFGHVSWERVLSGPGLFNIYKFLRDTGRGQEPAWLAEQIKAGDASAAVSRAGLEGKSELATAAMELFVSFYGAEAGNLALKTMALGGVYLGGGIAPKIIDKLKDAAFMRAFGAKGRVNPLLMDIPVRVILNDKTALLGAGRCAAQSAALI